MGIENNFKEKSRTKDWLYAKLEEVGLNPDDYADGIINNEKAAVDAYWRKQLEKVGILCLSEDDKNKLLWGYYTNNVGFCVEWDTTKIVKRLALAYVSELDFETTVLLTTMAAGIPNISTNIASIPEVLVHGENSYLITPDDVDALVDKLRKFINEPELRKKFSEASYALVTRDFSLVSNIEKLKGLYDSLLTGL